MQASGRIWTAIVTLVVASCAGGNDGGGPSDRCKPGADEACTCADGTTSSRRCASSGGGWLACACDRDVVSPSDVPLAELSVGETDALVEPDGCAPQCDLRECGADGCGGSCGECTLGTACSPLGRCKSVACGGGQTTVTGALQTQMVPLEFDGATVTVTHKRDIDAVEDGCLVEVRLDFQRGDGCHLQIVANREVDATGALRIHAVHFSADSQCPGFLDDWEGTYALGDPLAIGHVATGLLKVPDYNVASSCFHSTMSVTLQGVLVRQEPAPPLELTLSGSTLQIEGDFTSLGKMDADCPCHWSCAGKACGDDGCGNACGACGCGEACVDGACDFAACDGKACGSDGCGGSCGSCTAWPGSLCKADGTCGCQKQCGGKECGDDGCGGSCGSCGCGETCKSGACVVGTCVDQECGGDGCGGSCGACSCGESCQDGQCVLTACADRECGDDGCGGVCGSCTACGEECVAGQCLFTACDAKQCGNNGCGGTCGACTACGTSCGAWGTCRWSACDNRECGSDGCGGSCGTCTQYPASACKPNGLCGCEPQCAGKQCGDNGCGGTCGTCTGKDEGCVDGLCVYQGGCFAHYDAAGCDQCACEECVCAARPECCSAMWDWTCVDLCKTSCGGCGECQPLCPVDPTYCGTDGCGTACGTCAAGVVCYQDHCCTPTCAPGTCGDDGCGGSCAEACPAGQYCASWTGGDRKCYSGTVGDPCDTSGRCWDDRSCSLGTCAGGVCAVDDALCCTTDGACDDGNDACTTDTCVQGPSGSANAGACHYEPKGGSTCCASTLLSIDFEGPLPDFLAIDPPTWNNVSWHVVKGKRFSSADHALYFGDPDKWTCDSAYGTFVARLTDLALPPGVALTLRFSFWLDLSAWDDFEVRVTAGNGVTATLLKGNSYEGGLLKQAWVTESHNLSAFAGHTVDIELVGTRGTWTYFGFEGVWVDDLELTSTCQPEPCTSASQCKAGGSAACVAGACVYTL